MSQLYTIFFSDLKMTLGTDMYAPSDCLTAEAPCKNLGDNQTLFKCANVAVNYDEQT